MKANQVRCDQAGKRLALHLRERLPQLPHEVVQRLKIARIKALAAHQPHPFRIASVSHINQLKETVHTSLKRSKWQKFWRSLAVALPICIMMVGAYLFNQASQDSYIQQVAAVDTDLLSGNLPPEAYTDPGFVQFVKTNVVATSKSATDTASNG